MWKDRAVTQPDLESIDHLLTTTRAVRKRLDLTRPVPRDVVLDCLRLAIQAPTGGNSQGWRWLVIDDDEKRAAIAALYQKRANPYLDRERWRSYLNDVTIRKFKRILQALPFEQTHFQCNGFGGNTFRAARAFSWLAQVPVVNEVFTSYVFCVLRKPASR